MKKRIGVSLVAGVFLWSAAVQVVWAKPKKTKEKKSAVAAKAVKAQASDEDKKREALAGVRSALNNSTWSVSFAGELPKGMVSTDILAFKDNQFSSGFFVAQGFGPTNFSLTIQDDGIVVFETMQTSAEAGTLFWRGELGSDGKTLKGMFSHVLSDQKTEDVYFSGNKESVAAPAESPAQKTSEGV